MIKHDFRLHITAFMAIFLISALACGIGVNTRDDQAVQVAVALTQTATAAEQAPAPNANTNTNSDTAQSIDNAAPDNGNAGIYILKMGSQHRYDEPWGGDNGDPCEANRVGKFDDDNPNFRGFNVELELINNSAAKVEDTWGQAVSFVTASGQRLKACPYEYPDMGPTPGASNKVTFFTVVPKDDYVSKAELGINGQVMQVCFDKAGQSFDC